MGLAAAPGSGAPSDFRGFGAGTVPALRPGPCPPRAPSPPSRTAAASRKASALYEAVRKNLNTFLATHEEPAHVRRALRKLVLSPMALLERLAKLIPLPRRHTVRYHGVLANAAPSPKSGATVLR